MPFTQEIILLLLNVEALTNTYHTNHSNFKMKVPPAEKLVANTNTITVGLYSSPLVYSSMSPDRFAFKRRL